MKKPKILAPVGSFEALTAAIRAGANSVYFGVRQLNMRVRSAHNFDLHELHEVANLCKNAKIDSCITLNTILYNHDLPLMRKIIDEAKKAGISAIIIQDVAAMQYARSIGMSIHASTQLSISNLESVKFYSQFADTIVLAREVDTNMMRDICTQIKEQKITGPSGNLLQIEVFAHGALCIAQSGRCQMSLIQTNTSAQRGSCLHECRKKYIITDEETGQEMLLENNGYVMSPKDLCTLPFLDKLMATGIDVLKIEGRARKPEYVYKVIKTYRQAVDDFRPEKIDAWMQELRSVYNRGFCDGYYLGKPLPEWAGQRGNQATEERIHAGIINHYFPRAGIAEIKVQSHPLSIGDKILITGKTTGLVFEKITSMMKDDLPAQNSGKPAFITIPISEKVRKNDQIYLIKQNSNETT